MKTYKILPLIVVFLLLVGTPIHAARGPCHLYTGYTDDTIVCRYFGCEGMKVVYFDMGECENKDENDCPLTLMTPWIAYAPASTTCYFVSCSAASFGTAGPPMLLCN